MRVGPQIFLPNIPLLAPLDSALSVLCNGVCKEEEEMRKEGAKEGGKQSRTKGYMKMEKEGEERKGMGVRKKGHEVLPADFVTQCSQQTWEMCIIIIMVERSFPLSREQRQRKFKETLNNV